MLLAAWSGLIESIRTGKMPPSCQSSARSASRAETNHARLFNEGMASMTRVALPPILAQCDFSGVSIPMDVRGGLG